MLGGRPAGLVARQLLEPANYRALLAIPVTCRQPVRFARAYVLGGGSYPWRCPLRTPLGVVAPTLHSHHDVFTVNEVFCRRDYPVPPGTRVVVDIGSNIGIAALYFLTRSAAVRAHLFEPVAGNAARLRENLAPFEGRWNLREEAVAERDGVVSFGIESTGRYGGIGHDNPDKIEVRCRHINDVLEEVLAEEERIDVLKLDIEGLENATVAAIDRALLERVGRVYFETRVPLNPWPERFRMSLRADMCRLSAAT